MELSLSGWVLLIAALLASAVVLGVTAGRYRLPFTAVLAVVGFLAGGVGSAYGVVSPLRGELFNEVVTVLFLPILIFDAALAMDTRAFVRNIGSILVLAVPALVISAVLVGGSLHWGLDVRLSAALLFGVLISATDPVAVVAVFQELHVPPRLRTLVEGESLFNDAVAIVLFEILVAAALGGEISIVTGVIGFIITFFGGIAIGTATGVLAAMLLPWLRPLPASALTVAVAYGSFLSAEELLSVSGVMAAVSAGLVLGALAPSRASRETRELWHDLWHALGYIANSLLFLFIGLAIEAHLFFVYAWAIGVAIVAALVARPLAVAPLLTVTQYAAQLAPVGLRNLIVLIWGGLRGGIALALALALPEELPERDMLVAMAGGVVLATLAINATSIRYVVQYTGMARPTRADRFLAASAHLSGIEAAYAQIEELELRSPAIDEALEQAKERAARDLGRIPLDEHEELRVVVGRGLRVQRETYQHLSDAGLLPPSVARTLLDEADERIEEAGQEVSSLEAVHSRRAPLLDRCIQFLVARLPSPVGENASELVHAEATARRLAARRTSNALALFARLPNVREAPVRRAAGIFGRWEEEAVQTLRELDEQADVDRDEVHRRQAEALSRLAAEDVLNDLVSVGLLPAGIARRASEEVEAEVGRRAADEENQNGTKPAPG